MSLITNKNSQYISATKDNVYMQRCLGLDNGGSNAGPMGNNVRAYLPYHNQAITGAMGSVYLFWWVIIIF